jgi:hypothetical protein
MGRLSVTRVNGGLTCRDGDSFTPPRGLVPLVGSGWADPFATRHEPRHRDPLDAEQALPVVNDQPRRASLASVRVRLDQELPND